MVDKSNKKIPWHSAQWDSIPGVGPRWDDLRFPATADNVNGAQTRYRFDYDDIAIEFDDDARIANERIGVICQMPHAWDEGSAIRPHMHWLQTGAGTPNWYMKYRAYNLGEVTPAFTEVIGAAPVFTYVSGTLHQITVFPEIDLSDITISGIVDFFIARDTGNTSELFAGDDPVSGGVLYKEFDVHVTFDSRGSRQEFIK